MLVTVIPSSASRRIGNGLTYETNERIATGSLVHVPLRNGTAEGIVVDAYGDERRPQGFTVKHIRTVVSAEPLLSAAHVRTARWMAEYYACTLHQAVTAMLPPAPWSLLLPKRIAYWRMRDEGTVVRGKKQRAVIECLTGKDGVPEGVLREETGASPATLRRLQEMGIIETYWQTQENAGGSTHGSASLPSPVSMHPETEAILRERRPTLILERGEEEARALHHSLVDATVRGGKSVCILFPEVLGAEKGYAEMRNAYPGRVHLYHGGLTSAARRRTWRAIRRTPCIVVGTRSALFAPLPSPGLFLFHEEHDWAYKSEKTPRFHARLAAEVLCASAQAKLVLSSRSPSLESWHHAQKNEGKEARFHLCRLAKTPLRGTIRIVDLKETRFGTSYPFSPVLLGAIKDTLGRGKRCVLYINQRGMASGVLCLECRNALKTPDGTGVTVHHDQTGIPYLREHGTGRRLSMPSVCPSCGSARLHPTGAGTQKAESLLRTYFPHATIVRSDAETVPSAAKQRTVLQRLEAGEIDILVGTQSAVKATHIPSVGLAAALVADAGLSLPYIRAGERTFQALMHIASCAMHEGNDVVIQTFRPQASEVRLAADMDAERYLTQEHALRRSTLHPPFSQLISLTLRGTHAAGTARAIAENAQKRVHNDSTLRNGVARIAVAPSPQDKSVWHVTFQGTSPRTILKTLSLSAGTVDIDPLGM